MPKSKTHYGLGRRKSAIATVVLSEGTSERLVNDTPLDEYFTTAEARHAALAALELTSQESALGIEARVAGGGVRAQAEAVKLGSARALLAINPEWRKQLRTAGLLTRDARVKERKKFGLKRARRAPQFSKR